MAKTDFFSDGHPPLMHFKAYENTPFLPVAICPPAKIIFRSDHSIFAGVTTTCLQKHSQWTKKKSPAPPPLPDVALPLPLQPDLGSGFGEGGEGRAAALPPSVESRRKGREGRGAAPTPSPLWLDMGGREGRRAGRCRCRWPPPAGRI